MKKKLSILLYSLASGGAERVVSILLQELKNEFDITLFLMNNSIFYKIPNDIKIIYLENSKPDESGIKKLLKLPILALKYKKLNKACISLSFMNRPNYINILAKLFGLKSKIIISERGTPSLQYKNNTQGVINRLLIKFLYPKSKIIANSKGNTYDLQNNFGCVNVKTIYNPINTKTITKLSEEKTNFENFIFTFITIGRLDSGKNHALLIESIKDINAKLYIIGDGELKEKLQQQIVDLKLEKKVFLLGKQKNPYMYIKKADCFVFSSNYEGFPNVLLEALTCKLPIISTDCKSGPREILAPDTDFKKSLKDDIEIAKYGILTPINDMQNMKKAMKMIMENENLKQEYSKKALQRAEDFDVEKILKHYKVALNESL